MTYNKTINSSIWDEFIGGPKVDERFIRKQMEIAAQLDNFLKKFNWTQRELAEKAGLRPSQISQIMSGKANPELRSITKLEEALEMDIIVCPDFHEEDLEEEGWQRPGDNELYSPSGEIEADSNDSDSEFPLDVEWHKTEKNTLDEYQNVYPIKPTG